MRGHLDVAIRLAVALRPRVGWVALSILLVHCPAPGGAGDGGTGRRGRCGNGVIETGEVCDGSNVDGRTCEVLGVGFGTPGCREDCTDLTTGDCVPWYGVGCTSGDCPSPLVCAEGQCGVACSGHDDCPAGGRCMAGICWADCQGPGDCGDGLVCGDGHLASPAGRSACVPPCASSGCQGRQRPVCQPETDTCEPCTDDADCGAPWGPRCNVSGLCVECLKDQDCGDENACTRDACVSGVCEHTPETCDDGAECTVDTCEVATGCVHTMVECTGGDRCTFMGCDPETTACEVVTNDCDDEDPCTDDSCDSSTGCVHTPKACDDGDPCTTDGCDSATGACEFIPTESCACTQDSDCDDGNSCTIDTCPSGTCVIDAVAAEDDPCDTGRLCRYPGVCRSGSCWAAPRSCIGDTVSCTTTRCTTRDVSARGCAQLGWRTSGQVANVCGGAQVPYCHGAASWYAAEQICRGFGARLCTIQEIAGGVTAGTGCGLDQRPVWTATPCGSPAYLQLAGDGVSLAPAPVNCGNAGSDAGVVCCGDKDTTRSVEGCVDLPDWGPCYTLSSDGQWCDPIADVCR